MKMKLLTYLKPYFKEKTLQNSIILYENKLIDDQYDCPIMSKIYHLKGIDNSLIESLEEIANTHGVEVEEI